MFFGGIIYETFTVLTMARSKNILFINKFVQL